MNSSSGDYLSVKKRKLFMHNVPNKSSSAYIENKQFKNIQTCTPKGSESNQRFSIVLPNGPLAYGIPNEYFNYNTQYEYRKYEKEWEDFYRYHGYTFSYSQQPWYTSDPYLSDHKYQQILASPIIVSVKKLTVDFIAGKYEKLTKILTTEKVMKITKDIKKMYSKFSNQLTQQFVKAYMENFNIIVDFLNLNKTFENTKRHLEELEKVTSILKDKQALIEYLKIMNPPRLLDVSIDAPLLEIKEEYAEYHHRYGIPEHLNYDLAKLNHIKQHLAIKSKLP
jgi:hypothetical protein